MSSNLDKALGEIEKTQRRAGGRRRTQRNAAVRAKVAIATPAGGVKKTSKPVRKAGAKATPAQPAPVKGDSKVIVSNLPRDVTEQQIKEYFVQSVGPIKKVELVYGPNSQSRGIANVIFRDVNGASTAFQKLNGLLVDGRPIKIEIVVGAAQADKILPAAKTLAERTSQPKAHPKAQPKSAAADKKGAANKAKAGKAKKGKATSGRPTKKTAEELDLEMADYFVGNENASTAAPAAAPAAAATGEAMEEIM